MPTRQALLALAAVPEAVPETAAATLRMTRQTRALLMIARQKAVRQRAETAVAQMQTQIQKLRQKSRKTARQKAVLAASRRITAPLIQIQRTEIQSPEMMEIQETPKITVLIPAAAMTIMETLTAEIQEIQKTAEIPIPAAAQKAVRMRAVPLIRETAPIRAIPTRAALIPAAAAAILETAETPVPAIALIKGAAPTRAVLIPTARSFPNPA